MSSDDLVHQPRPQTLNASLADRIKQHRQSTGTFLLLDCSSSMGRVLSGNDRAIDKLRRVARQLRADAPTLRQVIFPGTEDGDDAREIQQDIPEPRGLTPLAEAILYSADHGAVHLIVVSDGMPNSTTRTLEAAQRARCKIDVCFIGNPGDIGERFLRDLAAQYGGACDTLDLTTKQLETK